MKRKSMGVAAFILMTALIVGCGSTAQTEIQTISSETKEAVQTEKQPTVSESKAEEITELTFADLSKYSFEFSSGAGAWGEWFTIEKDGYFTGLFNDSNMGETGEGYENGTRYSSSYSGHFADLTKINDYTYEMTLADISYKEPIGTEEISDNVLYIYTGSYCLGGTGTFTIYLPGTPLDVISEDVYSWIRYSNQSETELTMLVIADESNGYGIYSYDRPAPLEDAQLTYSSYKDSYDYYGELLAEATTTAEMAEYSARMYEFSDDCLNKIWHLIRYNVEEEKYNEVLEEQRAWIEKKENAAKEASAEYEGGSFATVAYNDTLATLTIERCEELIEYLK